jgi:hypothetical protein
MDGAAFREKNPKAAGQERKIYGCGAYFPMMTVVTVG